MSPEERGRYLEDPPANAPDLDEAHHVWPCLTLRRRSPACLHLHRALKRVHLCCEADVTSDSSSEAIHDVLGVTSTQTASQRALCTGLLP